MQLTKLSLFGLATFNSTTFAQDQFDGDWTVTAYSEDDCGGDNIGTMSGTFVTGDGGDRSGANGCLATTDARIANSVYIQFDGTNGNGNGNLYVALAGGPSCSGPGTYYEGSNPPLTRNSCQHTSASGCFGISKYQSSTILYSGDEITCLGIAKRNVTFIA